MWNQGYLEDRLASVEKINYIGKRIQLKNRYQTENSIVELNSINIKYKRIDCILLLLIIIVCIYSFNTKYIINP